MTKSPKVVI